MSDCGTFTADTGGAHPWCRSCGWRWDHHPDEAVRRGSDALKRLTPRSPEQEKTS